MINITGTNVTIMVKDMDESINFYESIGLTLQNRRENHYAMISATGITIGIHPAGDKTDLNSGSTSIGFMLDKWEAGKSCLIQIILVIKLMMGNQECIFISKILTGQYYISLNQNDKPF